MSKYLKNYLVVNLPINSSCWQFKGLNRFEIVAELTDYFLVWCRGSCLAISKKRNPEYKIEHTVIENAEQGREVY